VRIIPDTQPEKFGVFITVLSVLAASCFGWIITTPTMVIVPWEEGQCMWLNGTVEEKEAEWNGDGYNYKFLVNGTIDNNTSFKAFVLGDRFDYIFVPIGAHYEGEICDTVPLRRAVLNGTILFIEWLGH